MLIDKISKELWRSRRRCFHQNHGREVYLCRVEDHELSRHLISDQGYQLFKLQTEGCILRFPERALFDLSRSHLYLSLASGKSYIEIWDLVNTLSKQILYEGDCLLVQGGHLQAAVYICGPNLDALDRISRRLWSELYGYKINRRPGLRTCSKCYDHPVKSKLLKNRADFFLSDLKQDYSLAFGKQILNWSPLSEPIHLNSQLEIWKWLQNWKHRLLFILHAGAPILLQYLRCPLADTDFHVIELHAENDPFEYYREKELNHWIFPPLKGEDPCLIIDKAFSGTTLSLAKEIAPQNSQTLGLYPKTYSALMTCDYSLFADHLLSRSKIESIGLRKETWAINLLSNIKQYGQKVTCDFEL